MKPLRLWPGVVIATIVVFLRFIAPTLLPYGFAIGLLGSAVGGALMALWWLFFSRAPWVERLLAFTLFAAVIGGTMAVADPSLDAAMVAMLMSGAIAPPSIPCCLISPSVP